MSNYLAIATVTETIRQMLDSAIKADLAGADNEASATAVRPNADAKLLPKLGVNLYLYQVSPNTALRNADLPTRRGDGSVWQTPRAAIDLHYLLSFYGEEGKLEPQQVMGSVIRTLHASPLLLQKQIAHIVESSDFLKAADLDKEIERIKLTPQSLTIDELSKIWSVFFQNSFALSTAYMASVVFIEGKEQSAAPLPVRERDVYALPFQFPVIDALMSQKADGEPLVPSQRFLSGERLVIVGRQLQGDKTLVRIDGDEVPEAALLEVRNDRITVLLPVDLRAGAHYASVLHRRMMGRPPAEHVGGESNGAPFLLCPQITVAPAPIVPAGTIEEGKAVYKTSIHVGFNPACGKSQQAILLLNQYQEIPDSPPAIFRVKAPEENGISDPSVTETAAIDFVLTTGVTPKKGKYFARVLVDGAQSPVSFDPAGPLVEIADVP